MAICNEYKKTPTKKTTLNFKSNVSQNCLSLVIQIFNLNTLSLRYKKSNELKS